MPSRHLRLSIGLLLICLLLATGLASSAIGMRTTTVPAAAPDARRLAQTMSAAYVPPGDIATPAPGGPAGQLAEKPPSRTYTVRSGDTLSDIATRFDVTTAILIQTNNLRNPDSLAIGQRLTIPGAGSGDAAVASADGASAASAGPAPHAAPAARLPERARNIGPDSPMYRSTWVTYYGRPQVPVMGILGEYNLDDLIPILRRQARVYDDANGPELGVTPAIHLIYGMATTRDGADNSHLAYLDDEVVRDYIDRAAWEGMGVILDVQIGNLSPLESIKPAFPFLKYNNVQLALDPEFAMTTPGQQIPGQPPGAITAGQINTVQQAMVEYMQETGLLTHKVLIVHQFLPSMIQNKEEIAETSMIDVAICADGFGAPWPKISKYNAFMSENTQFAGFKLFYRWDEPLMTEAEALGVDPVNGIGYMEVAPTLIVYQ
jgi:LysM repeat protein